MPEAIVQRLRRMCGLHWPDPYAQAKPEPLQPLEPLPDLTERIKRIRADVADMAVAADMNESSR